MDADRRDRDVRADRTPLGRMCNAVRDKPERVQFVGYNPHVVRYLAFCFAGFFAGIAGALAAINFEIANSAYLGARNRAPSCSQPISAASDSSSARSSARSSSHASLGLSDLPVCSSISGYLHRGVLFAPAPHRLLMMHRPLAKAGTLTQMLPSYLIALVRRWQ